MEVDVVATPPAAVEADVLAFPVPDPVQLPPAARELDALVDGQLAHLTDDGELRGDRGRVTLLHSNGRVSAHRLATAGIGASARADADALRTAAAAVARRVGDIGGGTVAWILAENASSLAPVEQARAIVDGTALGPYESGRWKTDESAQGTVERLVFCGPGTEGLTEALSRANVVAEWTNRCRDLVNAPANELTPAGLAEWAESTVAANPHISFEVLGLDEIAAAGMGALAAVAQGSDKGARLMTLRYEPESSARSDLLMGLVGKAITFDAGGLSLKPALGLSEMKSDMGGGAAVLAGLAAIAELEIPLRIIAVVPACENMPGGHSYRPGDIVTALNGKTIEVTNTDAEGRLILADALWHTRERGATHLLDLATLTSGIVTAMGDFYAGLFGNDPAWVEEIRAAAEASGDHAWPWPLHDTYLRFIDSQYADMKNSSELKQATPVYAARFLQEFVGDGPWAHLDIAGTAFLERGRDDYYPCPGATGYGVRLLAELAQRLVVPPSGGGRRG
jgi:leucyl aminopeptidase